jgi:DmsE family decaheme c-type cytochrome
MNKISGARRLTRFALLVSALVLFALPPGTADDSDADCLACHENISNAFEATIHGRIGAFEVIDGKTGCSTCHGDGTEHMDSGGDAELIAGLGDDELREKVSDVCVTCHSMGEQHYWQGSTHQMSGVGCTDCHKPHAMPSEQPREPEMCWSCHLETQAQFRYPSHHPLREGHMTCSSCHTPHGGSIGLVRHEERPAELCLTCHTQHAGPFIFEHEPVSEGCDVCHMPHGSVANNLLTQNEPFLCLQCHEMHFHAGLEAEEDLTVVVPRYDPDFDTDALPRDTYADGVPNPFGPSSYRRAFTTKCTQCHVKVHGTDLPSQTVPSLGKGLMR